MIKRWSIVTTTDLVQIVILFFKLFPRENIKHAVFVLFFVGFEIYHLIAYDLFNQNIQSVIPFWVCIFVFHYFKAINDVWLYLMEK